MFYGGKVCPLIDTLTLHQWGVLVATTLTALMGVRWLFLPRIVAKLPLGGAGRYRRFARPIRVHGHRRGGQYGSAH
ncbi:hypothetical protein [Pseudodesulfovibrio pelocollis]|uniref:hypothetical protein n=1 Tax=Pseudodesulfovibrio pelocollis TaxID=3051432 RepID=UPI003CE4C558